MIEGGRTRCDQQEVLQLGFQLILYPLSGFFSAARAIETMYRQAASRRYYLGEEHRLMTFPEFND